MNDPVLSQDETVRPLTLSTWMDPVTMGTSGWTSDGVSVTWSWERKCSFPFPSPVMEGSTATDSIGYGNKECNGQYWLS